MWKPKNESSQFEALFDRIKMNTKMCSIILKALFKNHIKNVGQEMWEDKLGHMEQQKVIFGSIEFWDPA